MTDLNKKATKSNTKHLGARQLSLMACYSLLVVALTASAGFADAVKATPWLAGVTANSVYACLEANTEVNATVEYGLTTSYGSSAVTESIDVTEEDTAWIDNEGDNSFHPSVLVAYVHNVRLTDLQPNTVYNYRVTHGSSVSDNYTFRTAPEAGTAAHFGFAADSRTNTAVHNSVAGQIAVKSPNMMVYGGDLVENQKYTSWTNEWFNVPNQVALNATVPFVNAPGGHEGWAEKDVEGGYLHRNTQAFTESPSGTDGTGSGNADDGNGYFSFDYGDVHILVINNYLDGGPSEEDAEGTTQWDFVAADLAASTAKFKIVAFHEPAVTYGKHSGDGDMEDMTEQIFEPNGVDFVMTGHNHFYQHSEKNGIHHMVVGSMGAPLYTPGTGEFEVYSESTEAFAIFDTDGEDTLTMTTYRGLEGTLIETVVVTATPEPATMSLLAIGGLALIRRRKRRA